MQNELYDLSYLNNQIGDESVVKKIVGQYIIHVERQLSRLSGPSAQPCSREEIHRIAHSIKSGAGNIGAKKLENSALHLERKIKICSPGECSADIENLIQDFHSLQESITVKNPGE